ncbi:MAG: hypothetical protein WKF63_01500, partial [Thermomicrobiales bacterium]
HCDDRVDWLVLVDGPQSGRHRGSGENHTHPAWKTVDAAANETSSSAHDNAAIKMGFRARAHPTADKPQQTV